MPQQDATQAQLKRAILAAQTGRLEEGRRLLAAILRKDPRNATAWVWLGKAVDDVEKRRECFSRALQIDPGNDEARRGMVALLSGPQVEELSPEGQPKRISAYPSRCPNCGAPTRYEVSAAALRCPHCGTQQDIPQPADAVLWLGMPPDMATPEAQSEPLGRETLRCRSCGATTELSARTSSLSCPFCGSPQVVQGKGTSYLIPPRAIIPFQVEREQALQALRAWMETGFFRPGDLAARAEIVDLQGVYLPFWAFKGLGEVSYSLQASSFTDLPTMPTRQVQHIAVPDMLIPASLSMDEATLRAIEPFDLTAALPFRPEYLAGWPAEIYQVALADASIRARERMSREARGKAWALAPSAEEGSFDIEVAGWGMRYGRQRRGHHYRPDFSTARIDSFLHLLLPVWLGAYRYRGRTYACAVNGQTGQAGGEAPRSPWAVALTVAWAVVGTAALVGALVLFGPAIWDALANLLRPGPGEARSTGPQTLFLGAVLLMLLASSLSALWPAIRAWLRKR